MKWANDKKEQLKEQWASGGFMRPSFDECIIRNAAAQGAISILEDLLNISYEVFNDE